MRTMYSCVRFSTVFIPNSSKPPSKKAVIEWFRAKEIPRRAGFEQNKNAIATWFHGTFYIFYCTLSSMFKSTFYFTLGILQEFNTFNDIYFYLML